MDLLTPSLSLIEALQRYGWLGGPMKLFSQLGSELFFLLLLPLIYWNINRRIGARLGLLLIGSVVINDLVKVVLALPRPFWSPGIAQLASKPEVSFGFPSGHAQNTAAIWTFLALQTKRPQLWVRSGVRAFSFSRAFAQYSLARIIRSMLSAAPSLAICCCGFSCAPSDRYCVGWGQRCHGASVF